MGMKSMANATRQSDQELLARVPRLHSRRVLAAAVASVLSCAAVATPTAAFAAEPEGMLGEVVVTARKRSETAQEVPQSIDVFSKEDIEKLAISQFEDYANRSPSVSYISIGPGTQYFFMRGVSDGSNPNVSNTATTGMFLDDLSIGYYGSIPDLHLYDIERIEVLNGPQGTLYGAGSMSGAIRVITNKPDPYAFSAGVDFDGGRFGNGQGNTTAEGFLNLPLVDGTTAIRVSGFHVEQGGFIDNLLRTRDWVNGATSTNAAWAGNDYNTQRIDGERLTLLHKFNDKWKLTIEGDDQQQRHKGAWDQDVDRYGARNVARFGPEWGTNHNLNTQAKLEGDVGIADLVYVAGFFDQAVESVSEYSEYVQYANVPATGLTAQYVQGFACATAPAYSASGIFSGCKVPYQFTDYKSYVKRWTNEVRLSSKGEGPTHWLLGAYEERTTDWYSDFYAMPGLDLAGDQSQYYLCGGPCPVNAANQPIYPAGVSPLPNEYYSYIARSDEHQYAAFGELEQDLSKTLKLTLGARWFESRVTGGSNYAGFFYDAKTPSFDSAKFQKPTFKAGLQYTPTEGRMYYFLFAQGFREGGFNQGLPPPVPTTYDPDTLNSYEVGWKTTSAGGKLLWNGAVYYMPWKNYQTALYDAAITNIGSFNVNVGDARVRGMESNIEARPVKGFTFTLSGSYNDSTLTAIKPFLNPAASALFPLSVGERLPYVPFFKASASARYEWLAGPDYTAYVQFDESHTGSMWSSLNEATSAVSSLAQRYLQPAYNLGALRFGLSPTKSTWSVEGYVDNISDTNAVIYINTGNFDKRETTNPPRKFGVRFKYRFGKAE
jgi:iron complex outermembrane recepter protein